MKLKRNLQLENIVDVKKVGLVGHATIADGRLIPDISLDTTKYPEIRRYLDIHEDKISGDIKTTWIIATQDTVFLKVSISNPIIWEFSIRFPMEQHSVSIDLIMRTKLCYIRSTGVETAKELGRRSILLEVLSPLPDGYWNKHLEKFMIKKFRKHGLSRQAARQATAKYLRDTRHFETHRLIN